MHFIEKLQSFDRERIPERVVHARGVGAHGVFVSYGDESQYTKADFLNAKGKETPVFARFSTVMPPTGSTETGTRDPHGFAVKFYTQQGNYDIVGINQPVFFIRDAIKFPDFVHAMKPSPVTNRQDPTRQWDFLSFDRESTNMMTYMYLDSGTPLNYRQMDGWGVHAFRWVNAQGKVIFVKYKWTSMQGYNEHQPAQPCCRAPEGSPGGHRRSLSRGRQGQLPLVGAERADGDAGAVGQAGLRSV